MEKKSVTRKRKDYLRKTTEHNLLHQRENTRGDRPHIYTGVKPCVNHLYFSSNEHVL